MSQFLGQERVKLFRRELAEAGVQTAGQRGRGEAERGRPFLQGPLAERIIGLEPVLRDLAEQADQAAPGRRSAANFRAPPQGFLDRALYRSKSGYASRPGPSVRQRS